MSKKSKQVAKPAPVRPKVSLWKRIVGGSDDFFQQEGLRGVAAREDKAKSKAWRIDTALDVLASVLALVTSSLLLVSRIPIGVRNLASGLLSIYVIINLIKAMGKSVSAGNTLFVSESKAEKLLYILTVPRFAAPLTRWYARGGYAYEVPRFLAFICAATTAFNAIEAGYIFVGLLLGLSTYLSHTADGPLREAVNTRLQTLGNAALTAADEPLELVVQFTGGPCMANAETRTQLGVNEGDPIKISYGKSKSMIRPVLKVPKSATTASAGKIFINVIDALQLGITPPSSEEEAQSAPEVKVKVERADRG